MIGSQPFLLSHPLTGETPAYGGGEGFEAETLTSTDRGDTANTVRLRFPNHLGTHIDLPRHFFGAGASIEAFPPASWVFDRPVIMDVDVPDGHLITLADLPEPLHPETDLLLIRTGHEARRDTDAFWARGPGLSAELGDALRADHPSVRAVGVDLISITSRLRRMEGREAHRAFLDPERPGNPILLIEDVALAALPAFPTRVLVSPLFFKEADGAPVTIWAFPGETGR